MVVPMSQSRTYTTLDAAQRWRSPAEEWGAETCYQSRHAVHGNVSSRFLSSSFCPLPARATRSTPTQPAPFGVFCVVIGPSSPRPDWAGPRVPVAPKKNSLLDVSSHLPTSCLVVTPTRSDFSEASTRVQIIVISPILWGIVYVGTLVTRDFSSSQRFTA